jgi:two-component system sensor histidine kinase UhpB
VDEVPVTIGDARIGSVLLEGVPSDEIAEVWESTVVHGLVAGVLNLGIIGLLYLLFGRVLGPLDGLAGGLADLERRNYRVRLPRPRVRELAAIADRFNALAEALEATRQENRQLSRRLITAQDDERRHIALELHDEVGPCLFGLKAHAASIATTVGQGEDRIARQVRERVRDLVGIVDHLQAINRSLLNRLRPMALGHVPLKDLLAEIVRDRAHQHPGIAIALDAGRLERSYGDSIDLTIYRCIQEGLTNAVRHAQATRIDVEIGEAAGQGDGNEASPQIALAVRDNGRGIAPGTRRGFGLLGMQERVQALGGDYAVVAGDGGGTRVTVSMPVRLKPATGEAATAVGMP